MILEFVEIPHSNLAEVARMIFVEVCPVMVLSTCHTTTTGMLAVLAYTSMTGGDMAAAIRRVSSFTSVAVIESRGDGRQGQGKKATYCLRVFVSRVGIVTTDKSR